MNTIIDNIIVVTVIALHFNYLVESENIPSCDLFGTQQGPDRQLLYDNDTYQCICRSNVVGDKCNECSDGSYNLKSGVGCSACLCDPIGSNSQSCNKTSGECECKEGFIGYRCSQCKSGYYRQSSMQCLNCDCDVFGSKNQHCNNNGQCLCNDNVEGQKCDKCKINTFNVEQGCIDCPKCYNLLIDKLNIFLKNVGLFRILLSENFNKTTFNSYTEEDFKNKINTIKSKIEFMQSNINFKCSPDRNKLIESMAKEAQEEKEAVQTSLKKVENIKENTIKSCNKACQLKYTFSDDLKKILDLIRNIQNTKQVINNAINYHTNNERHIEIQEKLKEISETKRRVENKTKSIVNNYKDLLLNISGIDPAILKLKDDFQKQKSITENTIEEVFKKTNISDFISTVVEVNEAKQNITKISKQINKISDFLDRSDISKVIQTEKKTNKDLKKELNRLQSIRYNMDQQYEQIKNYIESKTKETKNYIKILDVSSINTEIELELKNMAKMEEMVSLIETLIDQYKALKTHKSRIDLV